MGASTSHVSAIRIHNGKPCRLPQAIDREVQVFLSQEFLSFRTRVYNVDDEPAE